jgi:hypothetical protein
MFAARLAHRVLGRQWDGWESIVVAGAQLDADRVADLNLAIGAVAVQSEMISIHFPDITTPEQIASLTAELARHPDWNCVEVTLEEGHPAEIVLVGVRWAMPDTHNSAFALGFANIETMPFTRRGPSTSLLFRLGDPGLVPGIVFDDPDEVTKRKLDAGRIPVHLADLDPGLPNSVATKKYWRATEQAKTKKLEKDALRGIAKAKMTFSLPARLREALAI